MLTNIDISPVVIKSMTDANKSTRKEMTFIQMDATKMSFPSESFTVALDKGTLDALMHDNCDETRANVFNYFTEIDRVVKYNFI